MPPDVAEGARYFIAKENTTCYNILYVYTYVRMLRIQYHMHLALKIETYQLHFNSKVEFTAAA